MHLVIFQFAGDFREAFLRLSDGGPEYYYAQRYSIEKVADALKYCESVTVVVSLTAQVYDEVLPNGVRAIGMGCSGMPQPDRIIEVLTALKPTHLVMRNPLTDVLKWAIARKIRILALFAESLPSHSLRRRFRNWRTARLLNNKTIELVGTYGLTSSAQYASIGVDPDKLIPWDFLVSEDAGPFQPKQLTGGQQRPFQMIYVGKLRGERGVGDILNAMVLLRQRKVQCHLTVVGQADDGEWAERLKQLGLVDAVTAAGLVPVAQLEARMAAADVVLVPSRHEYPEGFPLVIQHALRSTTPLIVSDHPMFVQYLQHGESALLFPAGDVAALADQIERLQSDPALYGRLSANSHATWGRIRLPVKFGDLLLWWAQDSSASRTALQQHRLSGGLYGWAA